MVPRGQGGLNHNRAINSVEGFNNFGIRKLALNLFAERIGVADRQSRRHSFGKIKRVGYLDKYFVEQMRCPGLPQRGDRVCSVGAVEDEVAKSRGVGKGAALPLSPDRA